MKKVRAPWVGAVVIVDHSPAIVMEVGEAQRVRVLMLNGSIACRIYAIYGEGGGGWSWPKETADTFDVIDKSLVAGDIKPQKVDENDLDEWFDTNGGVNVGSDTEALERASSAFVPEGGQS